MKTVYFQCRKCKAIKERNGDKRKVTDFHCWLPMKQIDRAVYLYEFQAGRKQV